MATNQPTAGRRWVPLESEQTAPAKTDSGGDDEYAKFVAQNRVQPPAAPAPKPATERLSLGDFAQKAYDSTIGLALDAGQAVGEMIRPAPQPSFEEQLAQSGLAQAQTTPAPVDPKAFADIKSTLGAMPREQRMLATNLPGWKGNAARVAIEQLDQEQQGIDSLKLGGMSPTIEGRTAHFASQGASPEVAKSMATGEMVSGGVSEPVRFLKDGGQTAEADAAARQDGRDLQRRSLGVRAGFAALEGMKAGTQGVAAAALRAAGDDETANAMELSARRSKIKVDSANELTAMRAHAQELGTVYGNDAFWENQTVGGLASAAQNAPQIAAGMALTAVTKNPVAGARLSMGLMTSQSFGDQYIEGRMKQMTPGQAAARAGIMAGFEYLGERWGMVPQAMKAVRGKAGEIPLEELPHFLERFVGALEKRGVLGGTAANVARGQLGEQFGEQLTTAGQYWIDGTPLGTDQPVSLSGYLEAARDTAIQTVIATGALEGAGGSIHKLAGGHSEASPNAGVYEANKAQAQAEGKWRDTFGAPGEGSPLVKPLQPTQAPDAPAAAPVPAVPQDSGAPGVQSLEQGSLVRDAGVTPSAVDTAAHEAATSPTNDLPEPTQAQKEAGNYKVGRTRIGGMDIRIENLEGSVRKGVDANGTPWETQMRHHYGYFAGTMAADGDKLDVFVKPGLSEDWSGPVFVIDQVDPETGKLDEHKVVMGAEDESEAEQIYRSNYADDWQGLGAITKLPLPAFKAWAKSGKLKQPLGDISASSELAKNRNLASSTVNEDPLVFLRSIGYADDEIAALTPQVAKQTATALRVLAKQRMNDTTLKNHDPAAWAEGMDVQRELERDVDGGKIVLPRDGLKLDHLLPQRATGYESGRLGAAADDTVEWAKQEAPRGSDPLKFAIDSVQQAIADGHRIDDQGIYSADLLDELQRRAKATVADTPSIAGKPVTDLQTGQLLRYAKMDGVSDRVRQVAAAEVKRRETEAMWAQREKQRQDQEAAIASEAQDQQVAQAVATSNAAEVDAPTAMADAFARAMKKKGAASEQIAPQAPATPTRAQASQAPVDQGSAAAPASGALGTGVPGTGGVSEVQSAGVKRPKARQHPPTVRGSGALAELSRALGGISPDLLSDLSEKLVRTRTSKSGKKTQYTAWDNPAIPGVGPLFRTGGTSDLSEAARVLEESGYLEKGSLERDPVGATQRAQEIIRGELRQGGSAVQVGNAEAIDAEMRARQAAEMDSISDPWEDFTFTPDDLDEVGFTDADPQTRALTEQLLAEAEAMGVDTESIREDVARTVGEEASQDEYHAATQEAIRQAVAQVDQDAQGSDASAARAGDQDGGSTAGQESPAGAQQRDGGPDQEGLTLQTQTEDDLRQKADREAQGALAEEAKQEAERERIRQDDQARDNKARADATVDDFQLGQTADQQLSGMGDLFSPAQDNGKQTSAAKPGPTDKELITDVGEKIGGARKDTAAKTGLRPTREAPAEPGWRRRYVAVQSMTDMTKEDRPWHLVDKKTGKSVRTGYQIASFPSQDAAEQAIPLIEVARNHRVTTSGEKGPDGSDRFVIMRDVSDRKRVQVVAQDFASRQEAMQYMHDHAVQIIETRTSFGEEILPKPENAMRTGVARRDGAAKGEDFIRDFGLRAVEFGNWNNQDERQEVMNHAYDALADLAEVINVPPKALSLNGQLGLAFGARGQGLSGARAHYEIPYGVINLTKMSGAGSLGHEWFHSLDHYFARQDGKTAAERTANKRGDMVFDVAPGAEGSLASSGFMLRGSGVRQEVRDAYEALIKTLFKKAETYVEDTKATERFVGATKTDLAKQLQSLRGYLERELDPKYYKRHNKPATAEQLAAFDAIAEQLIAGEGLATSLKMPEDGKARRGALGGARWTNDALEQISAIIKSARGVTGFRSDRSGMLDTLRGYLSRYEQRLKLLAEAQAGSEKQRSVPTSFAMEAKSIDQGRASDYWSTPHEMAARAFEAYVTDKVAERGNQSDFLAYGTNSVVPTPWGWKRPYPSGAEREAINKAFDTFLQVLKTKTDESGNVALFSTGDVAAGGAAIDKAELDQIINRNLRNWRGIGAAQVTAVETWHSLPEDALQSAENLGLNLSKLEGVLHRGRVTLVRSAIKSAEQAERILFHEIYGHIGLKAALDGRAQATLDDLWQKMNGLAGVAKLAKKHEAAPGVTVWQRLQPYIKGTEYATPNERRAVIMDELIAYLSQANDTSALTTFQGYLSDMKAAVVKTLRKFGLDGLADRLDRAGAKFDVLALVRDARNSIVTGKTRAGNPFVLAVRGQVLSPAFSEEQNSRFSMRDDKPVALPDALVAKPLGAVTSHPDYSAAKAGDELAAVRLASDLVTDDVVDKVRKVVGTDVVLVPVTAEEATGRNKIPLGVAEVLADRLGAKTATDIVQSSRAHRTSMDGLGRLFASPEFNGGVEKGMRYLLVDDTLTQGGTFAALGSHITQNGGQVAGVFALTGKQYSAKLALSPDLLSKVRETYSDVEPAFRAATGRGFDSLTESEARYLAKHDAPDAVRNRILEEGRKGSQRANEGDDQGQQKGLIESPEFKKWFSDSKIVTPDGRPMVVYHGTTSDFSQFDADFIGEGNGNGDWGEGFYFTDKADAANQYARGEGGTVMPVYLSMQNPATNDVMMSREVQAALDDDMGFASVKDVLAKLGYDGVAFTHKGVGTEYVVFDPAQIKSATGNRGTFDRSNPDIRFSAQGTFSLPEFGRTGKFIEAVQNRYNRWKQAIDAVRQQGGTVTEANDFYQAEERYWGIVGAQLDDFKDEVSQFVKSVKADGLELDDVALYAYAKHASERNAAIAKINPTMPEGGSGMTDDQAQAIIDSAKLAGLDAQLERHAAELNKWSEGTRQVLLQNGLISKDEYNQWTGAYQHYVPLRGQLGDDGSRRGTGAGFDIRGKESFRAMGRRSQAGHIIEHILQDRARALTRAGKNEVLRRFARFVLDNPDKTLWEVDATVKRRGIVQTPTGEQVTETEGINKDSANTVALKDGGQTIYITVKDDTLLKQLKNLHDEAKLPVVVESLHWANRLLSRMYTSLNPVFTVLNGMRDATSGAMNMVGVAGFKGAGAMLGNLPAAYREAFRAEVKGVPSIAYEEYRRSGGKTGFMDFKDIEGYAQELADMAQETQSWAQISNTPGSAAKARASWKKARGAVRKVLDRVEDINGAVENATRFATFKAARDAGKSVAEAANIAKNITINFNRRGSMTPVLSSWFLFFNPAVQGSARMVEALRSRQVQGAMGAAMVGMFGLALANAAAGGDDDDDGMTYWDKIPDEVKERNLVIMLPPGSGAGEKVPGSEYGRYLKIPMPYGYNSFAVLAQTLADILRNQGNPVHGVSAAKGAARIFKSFVGSWIPVSDVAPSFDNPKAVAMIGVPDALDPIVESMLNINSFGKQLYPEGSTQDKLPDSEKVFGAQRHTWKHNAARWLNEATGGSQYHEGMISITPATIDNLVRGYGGGVASFITSLTDTVVTQGVARDQVEWWRSPFVKQLYGEVNSMQDQAIAYDRLQNIEQAAEPLKRAVRAGDRQAAKAIVEDFGPVAKLGPVAEHARDRLTMIRKNEIRVIDSPTLTSAEKNVSLRQWDRERQKVYDSVNRAWAKAIQDTPAQ